MTIEWIVFDLGGVVIDVAFERFFEALPPSERDIALLRRKDVVRAFGEYEGASGFLPPQVLFDSLRKIVDSTLEDSHIIAAVNAVLGDEKQEVCLLIKRLSARYRIACLSNTNHIHWAVLTTKYPVFENFTVLLASHILGYSKPDPRIYQEAQARLGVPPESLFFIDDKADNVSAARDLRWNATVFTEVGALEAALGEAGVVWP